MSEQEYEFRRNQNDQVLRMNQGYKNMAQEMKKADRGEWNQLFDYNTNKAVKNETDWKDKFVMINQKLEQKNQNYYNNVVKAQDGHNKKFYAIQPDDGIKWTNEMNRIQDVLADSRVHQQRDQYNENNVQMQNHQRLKQHEMGEKRQLQQNRLRKEQEMKERLFQEELDRKNEQASYNRALQMQMKLKKNMDSPQQRNNRADSFERDGKAMIVGVNMPQTIGSSPQLRGGNKAKNLLARDQVYQDGGAAGQSTSVVNGRAQFLPTMGREDKVPSNVNKSLQISPGRYSTLESAGTLVLNGMANGRPKGVDAGDRSFLDSYNQQRPQEYMNKRQVSQYRKGEQTINLGNLNGSKLASLMQKSPSMITGADPGLGHNPITNPQSTNQQNPLVLRAQGKNPNNVGIRSSLKVGVMNQNMANDYMSPYDKTNTTRNSGLGNDNIQRNYSLPDLANRGGNQMNQVNGQHDLRRSNVSQYNNGDIMIHKTKMNDYSNMQGSDKKYSMLDEYSRLRGGGAKNPSQGHGRLNSMPSSPNLAPGYLQSGPQYAQGNQQYTNVAQQVGMDIQAPRFSKNVGTSKRYKSNVPFGDN